MTSQRATTIRRRIRTVPLMLLATLVGLITAPVVLPVQAITDLLRRRDLLPTVRSHLFILQYLVNDSAEILVAPFLWMRANFGRDLDTQESMDRYRAVQRWSSNLLVDRADQLLGIDVAFDDDAVEALRPGPVVVIGRHVSVLDSVLPGLLGQEADMRNAAVIMGELLSDPGFDLIYSNIGSIFIPRDGGAEAVARIRKMTDHADERSAYFIFPEGRLSSPHRISNSLARLNERDPHRAARLSVLQHLLPPRPGGVLALLAALPDADLVVVDHEGLDEFTHLRDLMEEVPVDVTVRVHARRIPRAEIPERETDRVLWLDELWLDWDRRLTRRLGEQRRVPDTPSRDFET